MIPEIPLDVFVYVMTSIFLVIGFLAARLLHRQADELERLRRRVEWLEAKRVDL